VFFTGRLFLFRPSTVVLPCPILPLSIDHLICSHFLNFFYLCRSTTCKDIPGACSVPKLFLFSFVKNWLHFLVLHDVLRAKVFSDLQNIGYRAICRLSISLLVFLKNKKKENTKTSFFFCIWLGVPSVLFCSIYLN
jgi:hypothetical protein